ncbi:AraC family transcriptional regulator [Antrihabitans stalactiti]|uniref:Helix-turn-helix domain-containing protein n=1 Tax=Antrihabitans stalactiti TaxID=2584121 RepID=A0A848KH72_9NOCA|nr:AraC family transcriptional regulator [Antrihabitans stalactiti]NMN98373.1 helix-turn-helix domain-containing protein [Antrihabitans stalactiti]
MTVTAATEIDVLDFVAAGSEDRWETAVRSGSGPTTVPHGTRRGNAIRLHAREIGDLQLADWDCPPLHNVLSLGNARDAEREVVVVVAGERREERPSFGVPVQKRVRKITLTLPRAALLAAGCDANVPGCLMLEQDRPLVGVLFTVLDQVSSGLPAMHPSEIEATRRALVALTAGIIRAETGSVTSRSALAALRAQIDNWITRNLRSGPIHIEDLAATHNVSTRTIHRAFSLTGDTMSAVVRARRMAAVREELVNSNMTIATIANRWCYYDASHLRREFHRCYGVSPSEYRESHGC